MRVSQLSLFARCQAAPALSLSPFPKEESQAGLSGPAPLPVVRLRVRRAFWRYIWLCLSTWLLMSAFILTSCSGLGGGGGGGGGILAPTSQTAPSQVALATLHWCNKPFIVFRDEHAPVTVTSGGTTATATASSSPVATSSPTTLTNWSQIEPNLGFTVYLPVTLPRGSCLVSASGTLNDPIFGGNFIIGYLLPDNSPLSLSEAPLRTNSQVFQCTPSKSESPQIPDKASASTPAASPTKTQLLLCTGAKNNTSIVFSGRGSETSLKQFFDALQPNVAWVPGS